MSERNNPPKTTRKPLGIRNYPAPPTRVEKGKVKARWTLFSKMFTKKK